MYKTISIISLFAALIILISCTKSVRTNNVSPDAKNNSTDIVSEKIVPGNSINESGIKDIKNHSGQFEMSMSGYKGELFIGVADGRFYGTVKFYNWGNGVPHPLTDLKVTEDKIYFKRVIKTKEDLIRYGGTAYFEQDFYGLFSSDSKMIKGYYRYTGTQDNWEAIKK